MQFAATQKVSSLQTEVDAAAAIPQIVMPLVYGGVICGERLCCRPQSRRQAPINSPMSWILPLADMAEDGSWEW